MCPNRLFGISSWLILEDDMPKRKADELPITKRQFEQVLRKVTRKANLEPKPEPSQSEREESDSQEQ